MSICSYDAVRTHNIETLHSAGATSISTSSTIRSICILILVHLTSLGAYQRTIALEEVCRETGVTSIILVASCTTRMARYAGILTVDVLS